MSHPAGKGLLAVASGKGGVGKTWLAITLAHTLALDGQRVLLVDCDLGLANIDIQLGLLPARDLADTLGADAHPLAGACAYAAGGFDVMAGRSGTEALSQLSSARLERLLDALREATAQYDTVVVDLGAGIDRAMRRIAAAADTLLVVATDEPTSLTDAYAVLKLHQADRPAEAEPEARCAIVVNQAATAAAGLRCYQTLTRATAAFLNITPPLAGVVRRDERVRDAIRRQTLLLIRWPACAAGSDVQAIARQISPSRAPLPALG